MQHKRKISLIALTLTFFLGGCSDESSQGRQMMAPVVATMEVDLVDHQQSKFYVGRIKAEEDVAITAQVSGYLQQRLFEQGQYVEQGQLLYQIDDQSYRAQVASSKAKLAEAKANLKIKTLDWQRGKEVLPRGGISQSEFDQFTAARQQAQALVSAAEAQLAAAEIDLSHTQIRAPFSGRISGSQVSIGDLITPSRDVLATIVSLQPIEAGFNVSDRERLDIQLDKLASHPNIDELLEVHLMLSDGRVHPEAGTIQYIDNRIDLDTGTITVRANFANQEMTLLPGQYVKIELRSKQPEQVIQIPRRAVQTDLEGDYVMLLTEGNIAERRNVRLGEQVSGGVLIREGLVAGDQVITKGLQRIRSGLPVTIQQAEG